MWLWVTLQGSSLLSRAENLRVQTGTRVETWLTWDSPARKTWFDSRPESKSFQISVMTSVRQASYSNTAWICDYQAHVISYRVKNTISTVIQSNAISLQWSAFRAILPDLQYVPEDLTWTCLWGQITLWMLLFFNVLSTWNYKLQLVQVIM